MNLLKLRFGMAKVSALFLTFLIFIVMLAGCGQLSSNGKTKISFDSAYQTITGKITVCPLKVNEVNEEEVAKVISEQLNYMILKDIDPTNDFNDKISSWTINNKNGGSWSNGYSSFVHYYPEAEKHDSYTVSNVLITESHEIKDGNGYSYRVTFNTSDGNNRISEVYMAVSTSDTKMKVSVDYKLDT